MVMDGVGDFIGEFSTLPRDLTGSEDRHTQTSALTDLPRRLMSSNSLVFKSTIFPEWYSDHIQPWLHYVPISIDFNDLWNAMAFFRGDENGDGAHDDLAKEIAYAGKEWASKHWRMVDMQVYTYRLLLEVSRGSSPSAEPCLTVLSFAVRSHHGERRR